MLELEGRRVLKGVLLRDEQRIHPLGPDGDILRLFVPTMAASLLGATQGKDRRRRWWVGAHGREGTREGRQGWPRRRGRQRVRNTVSELYIHTYKPKSVYTT